MTSPVPLNPSTDIEMVSVGLDDLAPFADLMKHLVFMGIVNNPSDPSRFSATMEGFNRQAVLTVPVLQGPQGNPGSTALSLKFENVVLPEIAELPTDLGDTNADLGKFWVFAVDDPTTGAAIATTIVVWTGTAVGYVQLPVGNSGPVGPYPVIDPVLNVVAPGNGGGPGDMDSWVDDSGAPTVTFNLAVPQGMPGPGAPLGSFTDVDLVSQPPVRGSVFGLQPDGATWGVVAIEPSTPLIYTIPTSAFTDQIGINSLLFTWINEFETIFSDGSKINSVLTSNDPTWDNSNNGTGATGATGATGDSGGGSGLNPPFGQAIPTSSTAAPSAASTTGWPANVQIAPAAASGVMPDTTAFFTLPAQPWGWTALVFGELILTGINLSAHPLQVTAQVTLNGTVVAQGIQNNEGVVVVSPYLGATLSTSGQQDSGGNPLLAAPVALVDAGTTGSLVVSVVATSIAGVFDFNKKSAGLSVLVVPIDPGS